MLNLLFFAVRNHQLAYFRTLSQQAASSGEYSSNAIRHRQSFANVLPLHTAPASERQRIVSQQLHELAQEKTDYQLPAFSRFVLNIWLNLQFGWLYSAYSNCLKKYRPDAVVLWNGLKWDQQIMATAARQMGIRCLYMENGALPATTAVDARGVNFLNSLPRSLDFYQNQPETELPAQLVARQQNRRKVQSAETGNHELPEKYLFVPFQVETDSQIICFSPWISNMEAFYAQLQQQIDALPEPWVLVIKEHPSAVRSFGHLHQRHPRIRFANHTPTQELIESSSGVITINSSVGIEALLLGIPVLVLGQAFYGLPGLVAEAHDAAALRNWLQRPEQLPVSTDRNRYLSFLNKRYLIAGPWRSPDDAHLTAMNQRIRQLLTRSDQPFAEQ